MATRPSGPPPIVYILLIAILGGAAGMPIAQACLDPG
jgi:hypothetical protein